MLTYIFQAIYKAEGVLFLLDDEDTVDFYEESGKSHQSSSSAPVQRELEALSSLDRVVRTEMVHGKQRIRYRKWAFFCE